MVSTARVRHAANWKAVKCPGLKGRMNQLNEYGTMAKLASFVQNRLTSECQEKWKTFFQFYRKKIKDKIKQRMLEKIMKII